ncbi:MAG: hypothetical protein QM727_03235 [Niabella sp.]
MKPGNISVLVFLICVALMFTSCGKEKLAPRKDTDVLSVITDPMFKAYIQKRMNKAETYKGIAYPQWDADGNGKLSVAEAASVTFINVMGDGENRVKSLGGIELFTGLQILLCSANRLTELNVTKNPKLTELSINFNQIKELDITKNPELTGLWCNFNQLTELNLTKNPKLTRLWCHKNRLTALDMTNNPKLTELACGSNQLTQLDITRNKKLTKLSCENNKLKTLDASKIADGKEGEYILYCGLRTTNNAAHPLVLTLRKNMKSRWETSLKAHSYNKNVEVE